jgi:hypothetical protein
MLGVFRAFCMQFMQINIKTEVTEMSKIVKKTIMGLGLAVGVGVATLPLMAYAANPQDVLVSLTVSPVIGAYTICTSATNTGFVAGTVGTATCNVTASANNGIIVSIKDADANTNLVSGSYTIPAISSTANLGSLPAGTPGWGFKFAVTAAGAGSNGLAVLGNYGNYNGVTSSAVNVASSTAPVTNAAGNFTFAAATAVSTPAGTYTDTVVVAITVQP